MVDDKKKEEKNTKNKTEQEKDKKTASKKKTEPKKQTSIKPVAVQLEKYTIDELCIKLAYKKSELIKLYIINNIDINTKMTLYEAKTKLNI